MRELVGADSASLPTASTGGDAPQQSEIVFRGNRAHRPHGKRGARGEESRNGQRAHESKKKCPQWRTRGRLGVLHPTRRKNEGKNLGRHLELSDGGNGR